MKNSRSPIGTRPRCIQMSRTLNVHAVLKAVSEQGVRLNIRKATLREWREEFARHLREQGIEPNATERAIRGECRTRKAMGSTERTVVVCRLMRALTPWPSSC